MRLLKFNKKLAISGLAVGLVLGAGGFAYAYFTASGTGPGAASVGNPASMTIVQNGAVYNSLTNGSGDPYFQDQCFACASISQLGNEVTLTSGGTLQNAVVAFRNWGGAITGLPITLTLYQPATDPVTTIESVTSTVNMTAHNANGSPSVNYVTFDFSSSFTAVPATFVYGISFDASGQASGLNVALSSSGTNISVGSDPNPGYIWVTPTDTGAGLNSDTGCSSTMSTGVFQSTYVWGCPVPADNVGAYGSANGNDIPAIEFNLQGGGVTPNLYPGAPAQPVSFTVTNPGDGQVYLTSVTMSVTSGLPGGCSSGWFPSNTVNVSKYLAPHASYSGTAYLAMSDSDTNQNACEGASLGLTFTAN